MKLSAPSTNSVHPSGAIQNRLDSAVTNLNNTTTNLSEAQSRIQDADYATEVSNMSKAQIIQQAGNSVLAKSQPGTAAGSVSAAGLIVLT